MESLSPRSTVQQLATVLQLSIPAFAKTLGELSLLSFGLGTVNLEGLDAFMVAKGWSPDADELPVLRLLRVQAHKICTLPSVASDSSASTLHSTWAETFPPKLSAETTLQLKRDFEKAYLSEVLDDTNFPSARLLSLAYRLKGTSDWKFISWKHRLSKQQEEDYNSARPRKLARFENFTDVLYDDVPSRNVAENMGLYGISNLLSTHSNALALADIAHLATLRSYERKFLKHLQARTDPTLRPPNAQECEAADRRCWEVVGQLRQEGWSVDDALHEFTDVRAELVALLAPRLAPFKGKKGDGKGKELWKGQPHKGNGKATGRKGVAGAGKGKSTFTKGTHAFEWASKAKINGEQKVLCMAYSTKNGCTSPNCKFEHLCPVILENGTICLQKHPAFQHAQKAGGEGLVPVTLLADAPGDAPFPQPRDLHSDPVVQSAPQNFACSVSEPGSGFFLDINGGTRRPLSAAFLGAGCDTFSVSPEIFPERDLLQDDFFFALLRVCHSGQVALLHILLLASDFSSTLFERMIQIAHACFAAGSHVLLSQHSSAAVWSNSSVVFLLQQMSSDAIFWDPFWGLGCVLLFFTAFGDFLFGDFFGFLAPFLIQKLGTRDLTAQVFTRFQIGVHHLLEFRMYFAAFDPSEIHQLRQLFQSWVSEQGSSHVVDWTIPEHQPYALHALKFFSEFVKDKDDTLCQCLIDGVPTGYDGDIPLSKVFIPHASAPDLDHQLSIAKDNWQSANNDPDTLRELVQAEVQKGWLYEMPSLQAAYKMSGIAFLCAIMQAYVKGLLGVTLPGQDGSADKLLFYRVCPFGANFPALWFQRLAGMLLRLMHLWIFVRHALMGYVDNSLFVQDRECILYSASLLLCFTSIFGVPLSSAKLQLGSCITWIGWTFNFTSGSFHIPQEKVDKLFNLIQEVTRYLDDDLRFTAVPPGTQDLDAGGEPEVGPPVSVTGISYFPCLLVEAFADARADGELIGIGGFLAFPSGKSIWFSEAWQLSDLSVLGLELRRPAHKDIACYETLAQIALVHAYRSVFPSGRVAVRLPSFSDNASTEALGAKLYTSKWPLGAFAQKLSLRSAASGIELDISHIAGEKNDDADLLSRWNQIDALPDKWRKEDRVDCSLKFIWFFRKE
ncbi:unnamed protein product, partial [Symbiodinium sp. CCMP2592]